MPHREMACGANIGGDNMGENSPAREASIGSAQSRKESGDDAGPCRRSGESQGTNAIVLISKNTFFSSPAAQGKAPLPNGSLRTAAAPESRRSDSGLAKESGSHPDDDAAQGGCCAKTKNTFAVVGQVVRQHPSPTLVPPILTFVVLVALGIMGTLLGAQRDALNRRDTAVAVAIDTGATFKLTVEQTFAPLVSLDAFIQQTPNYTELMPRFRTIAKGLLEQLPPGTIQNLQLSPFGIIVDEYPPDPNLGLNIFNVTVLRPGAIATIELAELVLSGPLILVGSQALGGIARKPVFVLDVDANETFGNVPLQDPMYADYKWPPGDTFDLPFPATLASTNTRTITMDLVYNATTRTKFWGFVTAIISFEGMTRGADSRLNSLSDKGYDYTLTRPDGASPPFVIAESRANASLPYGEVVTFNVTNNQWTLIVYPYGGWESGWKWPVVAAVIVISFLISLMVFVMMVSLKQQGWLLSEMLVINAELAETTSRLEAEKARMDVMLVRQYNLIQCFSVAGPKGNMQTGDGSTVDRIESMRQQLMSENVQSLAETEQIETLEVLGEGSFGKVYKGLWRGTEVAVKTMMLPANMTGAEKREKMAVMEAAISSSLMHPNIVSTYTYSIKPVRDTTVAPGQVVPGMRMIDVSSAAASTTMGPTPPSEAVSTPTGSGAGGVHSFEVRLVLEYCDRGCLRDSLDLSEFLGPQGLKYRAMLDTALDIAKAMCHLHAMNVLHSDLKARNVMLKCSGDKRGFIAKVADFGLSVKMDHMQTHLSNMFQGTMTHMAPEILLDGRVSKAADVYAFGITLWELFTAGRPFQGTPRALVGHLVTRENKRPAFPLATPSDFRALAERCWHPDADARPTFAEVLATLQALRVASPGPPEEVPVVVASRRDSSTWPSQTNLITSACGGLPNDGEDAAEARAADDAFLDGVAGDAGTRPWEQQRQGARGDSGTRGARGSGASGASGARGTRGGGILLAPTTHGSFSANAWVTLMPPALLSVDEADEAEAAAAEQEPSRPEDSASLEASLAPAGS
ncbi:hypothetical protein FOA52_002799 [Chlamydomonas sp. UWO 241]|nr:hypothetical protein FOA52_002799 [Chlamydomonas sp. UWO 241]